MNCKKCDFDFDAIGMTHCKFCPECGEKAQHESEWPWWCVLGMCCINKTDSSNIFTIDKDDFTSGDIRLACPEEFKGKTFSLDGVA